ncbi:hypothetical protein E2562_024678 [Oryza meyeriana var. granulata]|uniref:C2H2-type domain-containing protein n=1 Tax=Oryza meyeriana var. granulata TaxID=110450 RepID=A0A6G1EBY4_9ORYZ|nr:hypothetical protein E2562_024678 [Oryza meyeriana var. granulata]
MVKNTCKLCYRRFASPRALAGHMRSHSVAAANANAAAAAAKPQQISSASSASTSFTAGDEEEEDGVGFKKPLSIYALRENPKRSLRVSEYAFSDRESEAESAPTPAAKSARTGGGGDGEPMSSLSYAGTPEEEVALALMMLSRDTWPSIERGGGGEYSDDGSDDGFALPPPSPAPALVEKRTRFQCPACKKVFRSYQALGGHRASHVRGGRGGCCAPPIAPPPQPQPPPPLPEHDADEQDMDGKAPLHECPYCYRSFASGQALGGHKRSHVCSAAAAAAHAQATGSPPGPTKILGMIDLNIAPPVDEVELSAVSDPHFPSNPGP